MTLRTYDAFVRTMTVVRARNGMVIHRPFNLRSLFLVVLSRVHKTKVAQAFARRGGVEEVFPSFLVKRSTSLATKAAEEELHLDRIECNKSVDGRAEVTGTTRLGPGDKLTSSVVRRLN